MSLRQRGPAGIPAALAIAVVLLLALPAFASAADTYVDPGGDNANSCLSPASPCKTIAGALPKASSGASVHLAAGTYAESVTLSLGKSLVATDPSGPQPVIDNGSAASPAITVNSSGAGSIDGLTIRSDFQPLRLDGSATVANDTFDDSAVPSSSGAAINVNGAVGVQILNNVFNDPDATGNQTGVLTSGAINPAIVANTFTNLATAIRATSNNSVISDNQISLIHSVGATSGVGIAAIGGDPQITHNTIGTAGSGSTIGVLTQGQGTFTVSQVVRNEIFGNTVGVKVTATTVPIHLDDDLIHDNGTGVLASSAGSGGEARLNGVTFHANGTDIDLDGSNVTINSSILEQPIALTQGTESCTISYSRGPSTPVANGCSDYVTSASPQFVDPAAGDFHLDASSPLIDAGDPAPAAVGETDFYGSPRAVQGLPCDRTERDIGAAEYQPASSPQCNQDTFADATSGSDLNDCLTVSTPCQTIGAALSKSTDGHITFVADGTYNETPALANGKSLESLDSTAPKPVINAGSSTAIFVDPSGAGTISGLRILSGYRSIDVDGDVTVDGNTFDANPTADKPVIELRGGSDVHVQNNDFTDPNAAGFGIGVMVEASSGAPPVISGNTFTGLGYGVLALDGDPVISDNQITGAHPLPSTTIPGAGIVVGTGSPVITHNTISAPASVSNTDGIYVYVALGSGIGAQLSRNTIKGANIGLQVSDSNAPVTLDSDLIYGNGIGLQATDTNPVDGDSDVSATNATIYNNTTTDIRLSHAHLNLDSSAIGAPIQLVSGNGQCAISYSRGSSTAVANGCSSFDTNASPGFVNPAAGDYHLQPNSQMIDIGNPADPAISLDVYGGARAVQGLPCHAIRRDIGAAEFQAGSQPQCSQDTFADAGSGNDDNDCLSQSSPCRSAAAALSKSTPGHTTFLSAGTYGQSLIVDGGRSLVPLDPSGPRPLIDAPTNQTAVTVAPTGAGTISGLRIRSDSLAMEVNGSATIDGNVFDPTDVSSGSTIDVPATARVTISDNQITDPDASGVDVGVTSGAPDLVVSGNTFSGLSAGLLVTDGAPIITGNSFSGAHPLGSTPYGSLPGAGVLAVGGTPTISANTISAPSAHPVAGIYLNRAGSPSTGAAIDHNRISGGDAGVQVIDTDQPVTLANDLVYGNTVGLSATDTSADTPPSTQGDVSASGETFDNASDVQLSYTALSLGSSILMTPVDLVGSNGSCTISYSRGPAGGINGCGSFVTAAAPLFANPASGNYRLQPSSPLIDVGDPSAPASGATDFYGAQRALQGKSCSTVRRDIGAAEYDPGANPGCGGGGGGGGGGTAGGLPSGGSGSGGGGGASTAKVPGRPKILKHPRARSKDKTPTFKFASDVAGSTFRCKLDRGKKKRCGSPKTYAVKLGKHVFRVIAVSPAGRQGPARAFRFSVTGKGS